MRTRALVRPSSDASSSSAQGRWDAGGVQERQRAVSAGERGGRILNLVTRRPRGRERRQKARRPGSRAERTGTSRLAATAHELEMKQNCIVPWPGPSPRAGFPRPAPPCHALARALL
ncbi:hypothetical protein C8Q77DRAFT_191608 [Trametes polyzona]|nr:hypothetical protein C8Q77DRAFT_191608 [Trametes polyzona]